MARTTVALAVVKGKAYFAERIIAAWQKTLEGIFETGEALIAAKQELRGEFLAMVERDLPFSADTAQRLMAVARDQRLQKIRNTAHGRSLPVSWRTLFELTRWSDEDLDQGLASGRIHAGMRRADAERAPLHSVVKIARRSRRFGAKTGPLPHMTTKQLLDQVWNEAPICDPAERPGGWPLSLLMMALGYNVHIHVPDRYPPTR
jgi:hypothetical protein